MTTSTDRPSDWAVARAYWEVVMNGTGGLQGPYLIGRIELRARELDASGGASPLSDIIASMRNFADVADEVTVNNAPTAIRNWADMLEAIGGWSEPVAEVAASDENGVRIDALQRLPVGTMLYATPRPEEAATTNSAQISSSLVVGDWLPIESAPRDGTRIILGRPDEDGDGGGISVCGYWIDELEDGVDYMGNDGGFTDVDYQVFQPGRSFGAESYRYAGKQPTHWRPLPAAPQAAMGAVGAGGGDV